MLLHIPSLLNPVQLKRVREILDQARFVDGRLSAGQEARRVKNNQEMATEDGLMEDLNRLVMSPLVAHPTYQGAALPHRIASPFYARYTKGMTYGDHVDDPIMGPGPRYRTDISLTLFLNDPEEYAGGELVIRTAFGDRSVKLPAGDLVMYPSSSLHHVARVTEGVRLVAVTWVQSLVRDPYRREVLYELFQAREKLLRDSPEAEETRQVSNAYVNLVRMWAEL